MTSTQLYAGQEGEDQESELEREILAVNKAFAGWIVASWEMCPTHVWVGAAKEYCNKINRILKYHTGTEVATPSATPSASPTPTPQTSASPSPVPSMHPPPTAPEAANTGMPFSMTMPPQPAGVHPKPGTAAAAVTGGITQNPLAGPTPSASPAKAAPPSQSRKRRAEADPEGAPMPHAAPVPKPPLFSSLASQPTASSAAPGATGMTATPPAASFSFQKPAAPSSSPSDTGAHPAMPLFGKLTSSNPGSSAAGTKPSMPAFGAGPTTVTSGNKQPAASLFPLFGSGKSGSTAGDGSGSAGAAAGAKPGPISFGAPATGTDSGKDTKAAGDKTVNTSFSFGGQGQSTPAFGSSGFSFGGTAPAFGTPTFGGLGGATTGATTEAGVAAGAGGGAVDGADDTAEEKEKTAKVELKGDDKTDIAFTSKSTFRTRLDAKWSDPTVGALSIRKDKTSGKYWLQVNSESKGSILLYAAFLPKGKVTVNREKSVITMGLSVFKYPLGNEPNKTVDDGKGGRKTLSEKEENTTSQKTLMFRLKSDAVQKFVDALSEAGQKAS